MNKSTKDYKLIYCAGMADHPDRDRLRVIIMTRQGAGEMQFAGNADGGYFYLIQAAAAAEAVAQLRAVIGADRIVRLAPTIKSENFAAAVAEASLRVEAITGKMPEMPSTPRRPGPGGWHGAPHIFARLQQ